MKYYDSVSSVSSNSGLHWHFGLSLIYWHNVFDISNCAKNEITCYNMIDTTSLVKVSQPIIVFPMVGVTKYTMVACIESKR